MLAMHIAWRIQTLPFQAGWPTKATEGGGDRGQIQLEEAGVDELWKEHMTYEKDSSEIAPLLEV